MLVRMTSARALAYRRVVETLREIGPAKLWPREQSCIRDAADALLFSADLEHDAGARAALAALTALADDLTQSGRLMAVRADRLLDDIWACGPAAATDALPVAA
jgi:hypothetical protein